MQYVAEVRSNRKQHTNGGHFWGTKRGKTNDNRLSVIIFWPHFVPQKWPPFLAHVSWPHGRIALLPHGVVHAVMSNSRARVFSNSRARLLGNNYGATMFWKEESVRTSWKALCFSSNPHPKKVTPWRPFCEVARMDGVTGFTRFFPRKPTVTPVTPCSGLLI